MIQSTDEADDLISCVQLFFNPMDCSPSGSSFHGILQARLLQWVAVPFSRGSSQPRDWTWVSGIAGKLLPSEPPGKHSHQLVTCNHYGLILLCLSYSWDSAVLVTFLSSFQQMPFIYLLFYFLTMLQGMWDLSSPIRDCTHLCPLQWKHQSLTLDVQQTHFRLSHWKPIRKWWKPFSKMLPQKGKYIL